MAERDLLGYGGQPPDPRWPGGARVAAVDFQYVGGGCGVHVTLVLGARGGGADRSDAAREQVVADGRF